MTQDEVKAIFLLAGIEMQALHEIVNKYWPSHKNYDEIRANNPWWLVKTQWGLIEIGWRKRVISIDWKDTGLKVVTTPLVEPADEPWTRQITRDDVTMWPEGVHAWTTGNAVDYLRALKLRLEQFTYANSEEGKADYAQRREAKLKHLGKVGESPIPQV